jgi:hypothetical protein
MDDLSVLNKLVETVGQIEDRDTLLNDLKSQPIRQKS